ncbi:hypothetical protein [Bradyrhizobium elkanii]|uniref:hypothetical protein n=1 Tax=Bradyrhizobium elkanii TaxID=29448 RepID=UPI00209D15DE|nr:hypothetical protein [Bradyrhizobium elkanii]MCP1971785.1 hypothetical protein [Bradyrhizobium elkanii]MCS3518933.1 hypothetical protein [Bradyrhizobium elkanii]MCS4075491.1 hypothetical protein [Bradyrhizobium elkanii]MCS4082124.1 hypothetical protein [Bradyrhizobium elkanii]MCS4106709.1 hypothetical protein [Bradyrhizobium elkanii]
MTVAYNWQRYMTSNYQMYNQARLINQNPLSNQLEAKADSVGCCWMRVAVACLATVGDAGVLYLLATHLRSEKRTVVEASAKPSRHPAKAEQKHPAVDDLSRI